MLYDQLDTPCLLIDLNVVENNLRRVNDFANKHAVNLRPHAKTHKILALARKQIEFGAVGICCAKLSEAEVFANGGIKDIFIANQIIGPLKLAKLIELSRRSVTISTGVDSMEGATALQNAMSQAKLTHDVLIEIDTGLHRCGLTELPDILRLASFISDCDCLNLKGIYTHEGHTNSMSDRQQANEQAIKIGENMVAISEAIRSNSLPCDVVSVGATSVYHVTPTVKGITEMRPGTFIFNDVGMVNLGAAKWTDCALSVLCTVVSKPAPDRMVLDGGSKTFSSDQYPFQQKYGAFKNRTNLAISWFNEEHGVVIGDVQDFNIGDKVEIIPNHACSAVNMHDKAVAIRDGGIEGVWRIEGRGRIW